MKKKVIYSILSLLLLFVFYVFYLGLSESNIYSPKISKKTLIEFKSNDLFNDNSVDSKNIINKNSYTLINIWSSWCVPCRMEHPTLLKLNRLENLYMLGINYKDKKKNAIIFLNNLGNPFSLVVVDLDGLISISLGAYGVPETILVDQNSEIIKKFIGPLSEKNYIEIKELIKK